MIAAARFSRSSSETPEAPFNLSSRAFFSASTAACLRKCSEAFAASTSAIFLLQSAALGRSSSTFEFMAYSPDNRAVLLRPHRTDLKQALNALGGPVLSVLQRHPQHPGPFVKNRAYLVFDLSQGERSIPGPESPCITVGTDYEQR